MANGPIEMTTQTELEKRHMVFNHVKYQYDEGKNRWECQSIDADYWTTVYSSDAVAMLNALAKQIRLAAARQELIEWLERGATSGDAKIRRRIEEAAK